MPFLPPEKRKLMADLKICQTCRRKMTRIKHRKDHDVIFGKLGKKLSSSFECRNPKCGK
jgi:Zn-finger domain-containing protein